MVTKIFLYRKDLMKGNHLSTDSERLSKKSEVLQKLSKKNKNCKKDLFKLSIKILIVMDFLRILTKIIKTVTNRPQ